MNQDPKPTAEDVAVANEIQPWCGQHQCIGYDGAATAKCNRCAECDKAESIALALARVRGERDEEVGRLERTIETQDEVCRALRRSAEDSGRRYAKMRESDRAKIRVQGERNREQTRRIGKRIDELKAEKIERDALIERLVAALKESVRHSHSQYCWSHPEECSAVVNGRAALESAAALGYGKSGEAGSDA